MFYFWLADRWHMPPSYLLSIVSSQDIAELQAYFNLESYKKEFKERRMSEDERTQLMLSQLFKGSEICQK